MGDLTRRKLTKVVAKRITCMVKSNLLNMNNKIKIISNNHDNNSTNKSIRFKLY